MVVIEVDLKEGDKEPEQHLEDGEHIERIVVPLDQLYEKLQGKSFSRCDHFYRVPTTLAYSKEEGTIVDAR